MVDEIFSEASHLVENLPKFFHTFLMPIKHLKLNFHRRYDLPLISKSRLNFKIRTSLLSRLRLKLTKL